MSYFNPYQQFQNPYANMQPTGASYEDRLKAMEDLMRGQSVAQTPIAQQTPQTSAGSATSVMMVETEEQAQDQKLDMTGRLMFFVTKDEKTVFVKRFNVAQAKAEFATYIKSGSAETEGEKAEPDRIGNILAEVEELKKMLTEAVKNNELGKRGKDVSGSTPNDTSKKSGGKTTGSRGKGVK